MEEIRKHITRQMLAWHAIGKNIFTISKFKLRDFINEIPDAEIEKYHNPDSAYGYDIIQLQKYYEAIQLQKKRAKKFRHLNK